MHRVIAVAVLVVMGFLLYRKMYFYEGAHFGLDLPSVLLHILFSLQNRQTFFNRLLREWFTKNIC
jgi:hypothetical protein